MVIGSEELGKHRAVIRSIGLDSKHHKERKIRGEDWGGVCYGQKPSFSGALTCEWGRGKDGLRATLSPGTSTVHFANAHPLLTMRRRASRLPW